MARCHRIGQQKPVMVYRLLTTGSVEIDMMAKQVSSCSCSFSVGFSFSFSQQSRRQAADATRRLQWKKRLKVLDCLQVSKYYSSSSRKATCSNSMAHQRRRRVSP